MSSVGEIGRSIGAVGGTITADKETLITIDPLLTGFPITDI